VNLTPSGTPPNAALSGNPTGTVIRVGARFGDTDDDLRLNSITIDYTASESLQVAGGAVPEPATIGLLGLGLAVLAGAGRTRRTA
jgi:hypothetical protein